MRVDLPDGNWADFRELTDLKAGDAKAVRRATRFKIKDGVLDDLPMSIPDDQMDALLARIITMWSYTHGHPAANLLALDELPLASYNALVEAAKPYKEAVDNAGKSSTQSETESAPTSSPETPAT